MIYSLSTLQLIYTFYTVRGAKFRELPVKSHLSIHVFLLHAKSI